MRFHQSIESINNRRHIPHPHSVQCGRSDSGHFIEDARGKEKRVQTAIRQNDDAHTVSEWQRTWWVTVIYADLCKFL